MNNKTKNSILLVVLLLLILIGGGGYIVLIQNPEIDEQVAKVREMRASAYDTDELKRMLELKKESATVIDSILALRKYNIPKELSQTEFYNFINNINSRSSERSNISIEYQGTEYQKNFSYHLYSVYGTGDFREVYKLFYAIEQSKALKIIESLSLTNEIHTTSAGDPMFLVKFRTLVRTYFSEDDRFASNEIFENELRASNIYDFFNPLIRKKIEPNIGNLLNVYEAKLLALVPDGALLQDKQGNGFMLWEGDMVYLGYLTEINFTNNSVTFTLNKGGINEDVVLRLE